MAKREDTGEPEAGDQLAGGGDSASAAAVALAMGRASRAAKLPPEAARFLDEQTRLIHLQTEHLHEQRQVILSRLKWGRYSDRMKALLQTLTVLVGLAVVGVLAAMAWQAHEDRGLTIAAFSVPPDLAQRGLTGEVVAARVLDRLSEFQAATISARPASTYSNDWGDDIKVEIPEAGVSVGELNRYLREWLGSETRVTGEVVRVASGLQVTARTGADPGKTVQGPDADVDALVAQAAEGLYATTQPYRYAVYLSGHGKSDEALATYISLARSGSREDQRWAYTGWGAALLQRGDDAGAEKVLREGLRLGLNLHDTGGGASLVQADNGLGHNQAALADTRQGLIMEGRTGAKTIFVGPAARRVQEGVLAGMLGDYRTSAAQMGGVGDLAREGQAGAEQQRTLGLQLQALDHDASGARRARDLMAQAPGSFAEAFQGLVDVEGAYVVEDWAGVVASAEGVEAKMRAIGPWTKDTIERHVWPVLAVGYAGQGRQADAEALIARTPLDCEPCVEARGRIAAMKGDWAGAAGWFAALDKQAPEIPFWDADWGQALLAKGDVDGAIAKLAQAHQKGPHFADPLELWGEALTKKDDYAGAASKFAEADKDAPRWGRNHLRWGEALARLGKANDAKAQWRAAAAMDLSAADRAELQALKV